MIICNPYTISTTNLFEDTIVVLVYIYILFYIIAIYYKRLDFAYQLYGNKQIENNITTQIIGNLYII